jgi:hypothetical protein
LDNEQNVFETVTESLNEFPEDEMKMHFWKGSIDMSWSCIMMESSVLVIETLSYFDILSTDWRT